MKQLARISISMATMAALLAPAAYAGPPSFERGGGKGPAQVSRTLRTAQPGVARASSFSSARDNSSRGRSYRPSQQGTGAPLLDALRAASGNSGYGGNYGRGDLGDVLSELGRARDRYDYRESQRKREEEYLKLERTQMITNAVVGVLGLLAASQAQQRAPVYAAPPTVCAPVPTGHYETRRMLVKDGHYVAQQVWVPEYRDPASGAVIDGHYETHRQWVAPVYQETQVWVTH